MTTAPDNGLVASVQAAMEALRACCNDPADAVRLLSTLAATPPPATPTSSAPLAAAVGTLQTAMAAMFRRATLTSLARACASYQPTSYDDALSLRSAVIDLFDAEILITADAELDGSYNALRTLRASVAADLIARGSLLARLTTITTLQPTPSLTLAYRLYGDATRADDLAARADCAAPGFLPISFQALSS